jgi:hypothetical protein
LDLPCLWASTSSRSCMSSVTRIEMETI